VPGVARAGGSGAGAAGEPAERAGAGSGVIVGRAAEGLLGGGAAAEGLMGRAAGDGSAGEATTAGGAGVALPGPRADGAGLGAADGGTAGVKLSIVGLD
jgi:hypothetical protein